MIVSPTKVCVDVGILSWHAPGPGAGGTQRAQSVTTLPYRCLSTVIDVVSRISGYDAMT